MGKFLDTHPTLHDAERIDREGTKYTRLSYNGDRTLEQWTKDDNGEWHDTTEQARLIEQIELEKKKIKQLKMAHAREIAAAKRDAQCGSVT